jgi:hypothetical protein
METLYHDSIYYPDMGSQLRLAWCSVTRKVSPCDRDFVFRVTDMGLPADGRSEPGYISLV